jgi:aspartate aminotransferase
VGSYLDDVPFSGIIRIRDMMYSIERPFRLDQGDVSFEAPASVKEALARGIRENRTHYVQTTGIPPLLELLAAKLRAKNRVPVERPDEVMVTSGGIHGLFAVCQALLEPGDEVLLPDPEWPPARGNVLAARGVPVPYRLRITRLSGRHRRAAGLSRRRPGRFHQLAQNRPAASCRAI